MFSVMRKPEHQRVNVLAKLVEQKPIAKPGEKHFILEMFYKKNTGKFGGNYHRHPEEQSN